MTIIEFEIQEDVRLTLKIFDARGREVRTLIDAAMLHGRYQTTFDAGAFASGVYFYQLKAGVLSDIKKMNLVK